MKNVLFIMMLGMMFGQTKLETRVYEFSLNMIGGQDIDIDIENLTGYELNYANLKIVNVINSSFDGEYCTFGIKTDFYGSDGFGDNRQHSIRIFQYGINYAYNDNNSAMYQKDAHDGNPVSFLADTNINIDFILAVTAEFPQEEDTDQGDLNNDSILDISDVIILVDLILNDNADPSQLFDAMKRF